jgi:hypothetical protein
MKVDRQFMRSILVAAVLLVITHAVSAQISAGTKPIYAITFEPGAHTAVVEGTVGPSQTSGPDMTNEGSEKYSLRAQAGQHLTIAVSSGNHQALFTLVKPSPAAAKIEFVERAAGVRHWSGRLTLSGDYQVIVFTRQQAGLSRFKLRVSRR